MKHFREPFCPKAFTLIEMVLAIGIISIIMLGMQSAMVLASRAVPSQGNGLSANLSSGRVVDLISSDLAYATAITSSTVNSITFTVPDRNGDSAAETIQYSWSGVAGASLFRNVNNGTAVAIATGVREFALVYNKRSAVRATTYTESGEVLLSSYDGAGLLNLGSYAIKDTSWCGQVFTPTLPNGTTQWRVTRVKFKAARNTGTTGQARVQMRTASGTDPGVVLEETIMYESALPSSFDWQEFSFSTVSGRPAGTSLALVIAHMSDTAACDIQYQSLLASATNSNFVKTSNGGSSWSAPLAQDMPYYVYGTYSTTDAAVTDYWLTGVRCTLRSGTDTSSRVRTTIRVLNEPQVAGP